MTLIVLDVTLQIVYESLKSEIRNSFEKPQRFETIALQFKWDTFMVGFVTF